MKKESECVGLFIINGASGDKRKSLADSRFKVGSGVKMTTVTSKAAPKYEVIEKISCKKQCFVLK